MDLDMNEHSESEDTNADGDGVWSPDIEQCFREALLLFPPCGRRKHILQEEGGGKMYGRNELIARHIMMRTGKSRTRKQVSSHIQVLARRKAKAEASSSSSQGIISSEDSLNNSSQNRSVRLQSTGRHDGNQGRLGVITTGDGQQSVCSFRDIWQDRVVVTTKIRLVEFSAFVECRGFDISSASSRSHSLSCGQLTIPTSMSNGMSSPSATCGSNGLSRHSYVHLDYSSPESRLSMKPERMNINQIQDKFPEITGSEGLIQRGPSDAFFLVKFWANSTNDYEYNIDDQNSFFGFTSRFETIDSYKDITCSTKVCSYGLQVVEKVEKIYGTFNERNGRYSFEINRSPMCEFMIQFIKKLSQLPRPSQMNSVLENFTVLQVITSESTSEILLCLAYLFEVNPLDQNRGPQYNVYKLINEK